MLGDLWLKAGDMQAARGYYEQAQLLEEPAIAATLRLAHLAMRQADWTGARDLIGEAFEAAVTPRHLSEVMDAESSLEVRRGRIQRALEILEQQSEINRQVMSPVEQVFMHIVPLIQFNVSLNRLDAAERALEAALEAIQPPISQFLAFMEALLRARTGEFERAESAVRLGAEAIERFKADYLKFQIPLVSAEIAAEKEEYSSAAQHYEEAIDLLQRSAVAEIQDGSMAELYGICARMHVLAGELEAAQDMLEYAFERDGAEPQLWVAQAMLQDANGSRNMALASVNYALAIWARADPDYVEYQRALALRDRLEDELEQGLE
jgi:tetratricopeptide (TPR) repeat protein